MAGTVQPRRREGDEAQAMLHSPPVRVRGLTLERRCIQTAMPNYVSFYVQIPKYTNF